ncbi:MAG: ABC transporter ATP-binding protein, partial [Pyrinomonadaceae bacterium]
MPPIIKVENLGKQYRIGAARAHYATLRDSLMGAVRAPLQRWQRGGRRAADTFWAVKDINFEINQGEVVGIIGRNGAGKSTLLKILSRIVEPTTGGVDLYGRVGSLLEVGTGFHPELTGRENIFLNGAILGMRKAEIERKFDEIVAFAEVEKFIDTPVKYYSSGMYVRLAFAVAAHLEPEILIVDEVLAVGDAAFQKKCLGKMSDVAKRGRTVLFVSHNMVAVRALCGRALRLHEGCLAEDGPAAQVVSRYLGSGRISQAEVVWADPKRAPGNEVFRIRSVRLRDVNGAITGEVNSHE